MTTLALLAAALLAAPGRPDLAGTVRAAEGGGPVAGARVFVHMAGPRAGLSPFCPSCYADCSKSAATGADGAFRIPSLDPDLIFRVLVVAEGYAPAFVERVDPAAGPIAATLAPVDPMRTAPGFAVRGRVLGPEGSPVVGAEVMPVHFRSEEHNGFAPGILDPVAVTNLSGEFTLTSRSRLESVDVKVAGRGLAPRIFPKLTPGAAAPELRLVRGVGVAGRITLGGKPVAGVGVGLIQADRNIDGFLGPVEIATDETGRFLFSNVAPDQDYFVYGLMGRLKASGGVPARRLKAGHDGGATDVGELEVKPAHRLAGRVVLSDGKAIPPRTRIVVSRDAAWDSQLVELDAAGRFAARGLPDEVYTLGVMIPGYRISPKNECVHPVHPLGLEGRVDRDVADLTILYEPEGSKGDEDRFGGQIVEGGLRVFRRDPREGEFQARRERLIRGVDPALGR